LLAFSFARKIALASAGTPFTSEQEYMMPSAPGCFPTSGRGGGRDEGVDRGSEGWREGWRDEWRDGGRDRASSSIAITIAIAIAIAIVITIIIAIAWVRCHAAMAAVHNPA
jgi:hypothetical protein